MNAHQKYAHTLATKYQAAQLAGMFAKPRSNASKAKSPQDIHQLVLDVGTPETVAAWADALAAAAEVKQMDDWVDGWELLLLDMIRELPQQADEDADSGEGDGLRRVA